VPGLDKMLRIRPCGIARIRKISEPIRTASYKLMCMDEAAEKTLYKVSSNSRGRAVFESGRRTVEHVLAGRTLGKAGRGSVLRQSASTYQRGWTRHAFR